MNATRLSRRTFIGNAVLGMAALAVTQKANAQVLGQPDIRIGWTPWSDAEAITKLAAKILREHGTDVELTLADIAAQFRTVAAGDIDVMLMSWEPDLHRGYLLEYGDDLVDLGTLYEGTIGLAVPEWVPASLIASIEDLAKPEVRDALGGEITGIDPGAGLMATTREAIAAYRISDYTLLEGTGPKMVRALAKAKRNADPIVVTAWRPHSKYPLYGLRDLEDPKGFYAAKSQIHARASRTFVDHAPELAGLIGRMSFDISEIETLMLQGRELGLETAIDNWIAENQSKIAAWMG